MSSNEQNSICYRKIELIEKFLDFVENPSQSSNAALRDLIKDVVGFNKTFGISHFIRNPFEPNINMDLSKLPKTPAVLITKQQLGELKNAISDNCLVLNILEALLDFLSPIKNKSIGLMTYQDLEWLRLSDLLDSILVASNLYDNKLSKIDGYLVRIKIRGIHEFLSEAKKARELYINSWLASIILWLSIEELVMKYGADIVLFPNVRRTPLFGYIIGKAVDKGNIQKLDNIVGTSFRELIDRITFNYLYKPYGFPVYATVPSEIFLVLNKQMAEDLTSKKNPTADDVTKAISDRIKDKQLQIIKDTMRKLYEYVSKLEQFENISNSCELSRQKINFLSKLERALKIACQYKLNEKVLLDYDVIVGKISSDSNGAKIEFASTIHKKASKYGFNVNKRSRNINRSLSEILLTFFKESREILNMLSGVEFESAMAYLNYTYVLYKNNKKYYYCSVCGSRPSVLSLPPYSKQSKSRSSESYEDVVPWIIRPYFDAKEKLCYHCLVKRSLTIPTVFKNVFSKLFGVNNIRPLPKIISTTDIATYRDLIEDTDLIQEISRIFSADDEYLRRKKKRLDNEFNNLSPSLEALRRYPRFVYRKVIEYMKSKHKDLARNLFYLAGLPLDAIVKGYEKVIQKNQNVGSGILSKYDLMKKEANIYVSILYCDGDYFGKHVTLNFDDIDLIPLGYLARDEILSRIFGQKDVEFSLAYYRTISNAIAVSSGLEQIILLDPEITIKFVDANGNEYESYLEDIVVFPILFGGDDVILISHVDDALNIFRALRLVFTNGVKIEIGGAGHGRALIKLDDNRGNNVGFNEFMGIVTLAFHHLVRSFHIAFTHHKYPLARAVLDTIMGLDAKDYIEMINNSRNNRYPKKDILLISMFSGSGTNTSAVPISFIGNNLKRFTSCPSEQSIFAIMFKLNKLILKDSLLSKSFIYDVLSSLEFRELLLKGIDIDIAINFFKYFTHRNITKPDYWSLIKQELFGNQGYIKNLLSIRIGFSSHVLSYTELSKPSKIKNWIALKYKDILYNLYGNTYAPVLLELIRQLSIYSAARKKVSLENFKFN